MAVTKRTRYEVMKRDNFTCRYCRETEGKLTVDHVVPVALGGSDNPGNLVAACPECNAGKSSTSPTEATVDDVSNDSIRWAAAMRLASNRIWEKKRPAQEYRDLFADQWDVFCSGSHIYDPPLPDDWRSSLDAFYRAGLPQSVMVQAIGITMSKPHIHKSEKFRYFAGVCWSSLTEIQDEARAMLARDEANDAT